MNAHGTAHANTRKSTQAKNKKTKIRVSTGGRKQLRWISLLKHVIVYRHLMARSCILPLTSAAHSPSTRLQKDLKLPKVNRLHRIADICQRNYPLGQVHDVFSVSVPHFLLQNQSRALEVNQLEVNRSEVNKSVCIDTLIGAYQYDLEHQYSHV